VADVQDFQASGPHGPIPLDRTRMAVGGNSAGGNLAAVVAICARDAGDLDRLPEALVLTAGCDPLRDEGLMCAHRMTQDGTRATHIFLERQIHGFITMGRVIDEANSAVAICAALVGRALRTPLRAERCRGSTRRVCVLAKHMQERMLQIGNQVVRVLESDR
jgi:acetyl esterase/lipase